PELHQVPQNDNDVVSEVTGVEQDLNKQLSKEKSTVSFLIDEKKKLKSDFKTCKDKLLDKQIQLEKKIKELNNIVFKTGQSIQTMHMLSPKQDSFDHTEHKMAFEQRSLKPGLQSMTSGHISSGLDLTYAPSTITTQQPSKGELDL
nr:hypothetical protein [Tanacetum cinerariifolium]